MTTAGKVLAWTAGVALAFNIAVALIQHEWITAAAWTVALGWMLLFWAADRSADRMMTAYVLAVGRGLSAYARGYRHGVRREPFHAGKD